MKLGPEATQGSLVEFWLFLPVQNLPGSRHWDKILIVLQVSRSRQIDGPNFIYLYKQNSIDVSYFDLLLIHSELEKLLSEWNTFNMI